MDSKFNKFKNKKEFVEEFKRRIIERYGRSIEEAHITEKYMVLGEMVRDINRTQVSREERLSDCVYEYDKEKSAIRQVPESVRRRERER